VTVLGIETSCDECAASVVEDGRVIRSNVIASQVDFHRPFYGVVPEIASRKHTEAIAGVVRKALEDSDVTVRRLDAIAVTVRPGLIGSLLVGVSFAKGLSLTLGLPLVGVDHVEAHLYAAQIGAAIPFPYLGLLVSGGNTLLSVVRGYFAYEVLGTTIDDACGEALDKIAKFYDMGYPGGAAIDRLSELGSPEAFSFPTPSLHKGEHRYDVSYSGLKTAAVNQLDQFLNPGFAKSRENIAAAFQRSAIDLLVERVLLAARDTGIRRVVVGGGVAANRYLRRRLGGEAAVDAVFPPMVLCTDNAAMIAGLGYHHLLAGHRSGLDLTPSPRVAAFRRAYP
jgi:N6-L-threonylcarbamoyladenine synthase